MFQCRFFQISLSIGKPLVFCPSNFVPLGIFPIKYLIVSFSRALRAVQMNIEGTQMMVDLARKMPQLKAFVHTSTAFSHCYNEHIEEKFYPGTAFTPDDIIDLCKTSDDEAGQILQIIVSYPNIFSF